MYLYYAYEFWSDSLVGRFSGKAKIEKLLERPDNAEVLWKLSYK